MSDSEIFLDNEVCGYCGRELIYNRKHNLIYCANSDCGQGRVLCRCMLKEGYSCNETVVWNGKSFVHKKSGIKHKPLMIKIDVLPKYRKVK